MDRSKYVILGGGMVAGYAAKQMVESGLKPGDLAILSADNAIPYERPPLSKGFLAGKDTEESVRINPEDFYQKQGIDVRLRCDISAVDVKNKKLTLKAGGEFGFARLVIATGAEPRSFDLPGARLRNLYYLRSLDDSKTIRKAADGVKRAAVIGGGFIGMEVASVLAQKKIDVTMVLSEDRVGKRIFTPRMSAFFESYYEARGVRFLKMVKVTALRGDGAIKAVTLGNGQEVKCELAVAGIGVKPVTAVLAGSGIELDNGVLVNEFLETNQADIYAAGDVANYQDVIFKKRRRVEHWDNAVSQGQHCARTLLGERAVFRHVPYFFSDVFDLSYEYWGDASDSDEVVHRGDLQSNSFSVWWLQKSRVVAVFTMNRPDEERELAPKWIEAGHTVTGASLSEAKSLS
jgi:NADPH-dependent 2,4-dienoyl-CoA reductase/sulfur reductase-like enzyme